MQNDTERAVIGVDGVDVSHLDEGEQGKQRQAEHDDSGAGSRPCASVTACPSVKCGQTLSILTGSVYRKNTQDWMRSIPRCKRLKHAYSNQTQTRH
jgi:hypothetical protein